MREAKSFPENRIGDRLFDAITDAAWGVGSASLELVEAAADAVLSVLSSVFD